MTLPERGTGTCTRRKVTPVRVQHLLLAAVSIGAAESSLQEKKALPITAPKAQRSEVLRGCWSVLKRAGLGPRTIGDENCSDGTSAAPPR